MKVFLLAVVLLALGVAGMAVTMLVKKDGRFPDGEISHNQELRRRGVICAKEEELKLWRKRHPGADGNNKRPDVCPEGGCDGCAYFEIEKPSDKC